MEIKVMFIFYIVVVWLAYLDEGGLKFRTKVGGGMSFKWTPRTPRTRKAKVVASLIAAALIVLVIRTDW